MLDLVWAAFGLLIVTLFVVGLTGWLHDCYAVLATRRSSEQVPSRPHA
jgi:hypothetical protein